MKKIGFFLSTMIAGFLVIAASLTSAKKPEILEIEDITSLPAPKRQCRDKYQGGRKPTREELSRILAEHSEWVRSGKTKGRRASLCGADLRGVDLRGVDLSGADLFNARLNGAMLERVNLSRADLAEASLATALMDEANLSGANLTGADLRGAVLFWADLSGAYMFEADLSGALLNWADLRGAELLMADLQLTVLDLKAGALPDIPSIALAKNLSKVTFAATPLSLVELREEFKKKGLRKAEREITFAMKRTERRKAWKRGITGRIESSFNFILFELTCDYGMSPGRPLLIVITLIPLFSIPYMIALKRRRRSGIWAILPDDRIRNRKRSYAKAVQLTSDFPAKGRWPGGKRLRSVAPVLRMFRIGLYFSLLSAFRIGWRELDVGNWIMRLQMREYTLRAIGWVRFVSGLQSLISVYMLALWLLTYFGHPFE